MVWQVYLYGIEWGSADSELPPNLRVTVHTDDADTTEEAIEVAMSEAADEFGANVQSTEQINVTYT